MIDHDTSRHIATLNRFLEAAGVVADDVPIAEQNRGGTRPRKDRIRNAPLVKEHRHGREPGSASRSSMQESGYGQNEAM